MGFKRPLCPDNIGNLIAAGSNPIKPDIIKHVGRTNKLPIGYLKTHTDDTRWTVKPGTVSVTQPYRHERTMVRSPHPACDKHRSTERFDDLSNSRKAAL